MQELNEKLAAELAEVKTRGSSDAEALTRVKQQAAELSEDLEAANRELEVLHLSSTCSCQHQSIKRLNASRSVGRSVCSTFTPSDGVVIQWRE